jgi:hypothetical protein
MDSYFKLLRAEEEILRLNVEVRRFATFIRDKSQYLHTMEQQNHSQLSLAFQICMKRMEKGCFDALQMKTLHQITQLNGFTGDGLYDIHLPKTVYLPSKAVTQQEPLIPVGECLSMMRSIRRP